MVLFYFVDNATLSNMADNKTKKALQKNVMSSDNPSRLDILKDTVSNLYGKQFRDAFLNSMNRELLNINSNAIIEREVGYQNKDNTEIQKSVATKEFSLTRMTNHDSEFLKKHNAGLTKRIKTNRGIF